MSRFLAPSLMAMKVDINFYLTILEFNNPSIKMDQHLDRRSCDLQQNCVLIYEDFPTLFVHIDMGGI